MIHRFFVLFVLFYYRNVWSLSDPSPPPPPTTIDGDMKSQSVILLNTIPSTIPTNIIAKFLIATFLFIGLSVFLFSQLIRYIIFLPHHIPLNYNGNRKIRTHTFLNSFATIHILSFLFAYGILIIDLNLHEVIICALFSTNGLPSLNIPCFEIAKIHSYHLSCLAFFASSYSPWGDLCCIFILSLSICLRFRKIPAWYLFLILLISHDIETNPGPNIHGNDFELEPQFSWQK